MPISPPATSTPASFEPIYITEDDLLDLSSFTGLSKEACLERVRSYSLEELATAWKTADPKTPEEIVAFYQSTDLYIWELMQWHASTARQQYWRAISYVAEHHPPGQGWRRVYDFGCGVGTDGLFFATRGYDVTLVDVESPPFRFARHRFERRGVRGRFVESKGPLPDPDGEYDVVICFDVFEHMPDPLGAAARLAGALRKHGLLVQQGGFSDEGYHPCHLHHGITLYGGLRWQIHLLKLGFQNVNGLVYKKTSGWRRSLQRARFSLWRTTGLWVSRVPR